MNYKIVNFLLNRFSIFWIWHHPIYYHAVHMWMYNTICGHINLNVPVFHWLLYYGAHMPIFMSMICAQVCVAYTIIYYKGCCKWGTYARLMAMIGTYECTAAPGLSILPVYPQLDHKPVPKQLMARVWIHG